MPSNAFKPNSPTLARPKVCKASPSVATPPAPPPPETTCTLEQSGGEVGPGGEVVGNLYGYTEDWGEGTIHFYLYATGGEWEPTHLTGANGQWIEDEALWTAPEETGEYTLSLLVIWPDYATCEDAGVVTVTEES